MHRIAGSKGIVHAVEGILFVALVMENAELRGIEKAAGVQPVKGKKVAPILLAIAQIEAARSRAEASVGGINRARRRQDALPGAGGRNDHQAGFASEFSRRRAADDLNGLNGVGG